MAYDVSNEDDWENLDDKILQVRSVVGIIRDAVGNNKNNEDFTDLTDANPVIAIGDREERLDNKNNTELTIKNNTELTIGNEKTRRDSDASNLSYEKYPDITEEFVDAAKEYHKWLCDIDQDSEEINEDLVAYDVGGTFSLFTKVLSYDRDNYGVAFIAPIYGSFIHKTKDFAGIEPILSEAKRQEDGSWKIDVEGLAKVLGEKDSRGNWKVKYLVMNYPNNPTGQIMDKEIAQDICDAILQAGRENDLTIFSDEVASSLVPLDKSKNISFGSFARRLGIDRVITCFSLSKTKYPQERIAVAFFPKALKKLQSILSRAEPPNYNLQKTFVDLAGGIVDGTLRKNAADAIERKKGYVIDNVQRVNKNLKGISGSEEEIIKLERSDAGNIMLLNFSSLRGVVINDEDGRIGGEDKKGVKYSLQNDRDIAIFLLKFANVAVIPGSSSYSKYLERQMCARINLSHSPKTFEKVFNRIEAAIQSHLEFGKEPRPSPRNAKAEQFPSLSSGIKSL